jgi:hypothetical protein
LKRGNISFFLSFSHFHEVGPWCRCFQAAHYLGTYSWHTHFTPNICLFTYVGDSALEKMKAGIISFNNVILFYTIIRTRKETLILMALHANIA